MQYVCTAHHSDLSVIIVLPLAATTVTSESSRWVSNLPSVTNFLDPVLWKCSYGPWDHFMFSAKNSILLAKRYQKNPQGGFPTFQIDVQMQSSIISRVAKGFYFFEKGSYILEKGFYILEKDFYILEKGFYIFEKGFYILESAIVEIWWAR